MRWASWRTTVAGIVFIALAALRVYLRSRGVTEYESVIDMAQAATGGAGLWAARDNKVTSERAIGRAAPGVMKNAPTHDEMLRAVEVENAQIKEMKRRG